MSEAEDLVVSTQSSSLFVNYRWPLRWAWINRLAFYDGDDRVAIREQWERFEALMWIYENNWEKFVGLFKAGVGYVVKMGPYGDPRANRWDWPTIQWYMQFASDDLPNE